MTSRWMDALEMVAVRLNRAGVDWMLVGSAATAIRGVEIEPGDLDIALPTPAAVYAAAHHFPSRTDKPPTSDPDGWYSSVAQPVRDFTDHAGSRWVFGRWTIDGVKVELAHIDRPGTADLLVETFGQAVWAARGVLAWQRTQVPVVPIETQLVTMMLREQYERLEATLSTVGLDVDIAMLRRAITDRQTEAGHFHVPDPVERILTDSSAG